MSDNMPDVRKVLENDRALLLPLTEDDFEALYAVASDPAVWEQHPNNNRWQRAVFQNYFEGAMQHKSGYKIIDKQTGEIAGSSRYYDYNPEENSILVGYTFYATKYWGTGMNTTVKKLMLDHIFQYVSKVYLLFCSSTHRCLSNSYIKFSLTGSP